MPVSRRSYYGGRPKSSGSKASNASKASRTFVPDSNNRVVLNHILNNFPCDNEMHKCGQHQSLWGVVMADSDDTRLGVLSRMSFVTLRNRYGMYIKDAQYFQKACKAAFANRP